MTGTAATTCAGEWADNPLANAVYAWVADSGDLDPTVGAPLADQFADLTTPAPLLWRGLDESWPAPAARPGERWTATGPRWAAFTVRRDYATLWAHRVLLELRDAAAVSLPGLAATHPGFVEPVTDDQRARLYYNDDTLYDRIHAEQEWLVRGTFRVTGSYRDGPLLVVQLTGPDLSAGGG